MSHNQFQSDKLKQYYDTFLKLKDRPTLRKRLMHEVYNILHLLESLDEIFQGTLIRIGSASEGLQVISGDEFDFNVTLAISESLEWHGTPNNDGQTVELFESRGCLDTWYAKVRLTGEDEERFAQLLDEDGYLSSAKVKDILHHCLVVAKSKDDNLARIRKSSPAMTLEMNIPGQRRNPGFTASVDFAVCIRASLPFEESNNWPRPTSSWLNDDQIQQIKNKGINLVARGSRGWRQSFSECETLIVQFIREMDSKDDGVRIMCLLLVKGIMKKLLYKRTPTLTTTPTLTSYMLKNVWLWEIERKCHESDWKPNKLCQRCTEFIKRLKAFLVVGHLPVYFSDGINLLARKNVSQLKKEVLSIATGIKYIIKQSDESISGSDDSSDDEPSVAASMRRLLIVSD